MRKLFGTDGVRGIAGDFLTYELAESIGYALGTVLNKSLAGNDTPKVLIGTDTRVSKDFLKEAISKGLARQGCDSYDVGVVSTPAVAYLTKKNGFAAGVMISASHNSYEYNGIKIFGSDGFKLMDEEEEEIERIIFSGEKNESENQGKLYEVLEMKDEYIAYIRARISGDYSGISAVIDCANGSAEATAREIFEGSGIKAEYIGCASDGYNINKGCGSTKLDLLSKKVLECGADIGLAFDGDADRFLAIDSEGREVDGDFVIAILSLMLKEQGKLNNNTVVGTVMSNYGFTKFAKENDVTFIAAKVGDRYVLEEMEKNNYSLGGEQSGHVIIREAATTGDGQLTAVYLLNRMAETKKSLSELASVMTKFPQHMVNVTADREAKLAFSSDERIKSIIKNAEAELGSSGRILVRPSGTEPVVRIMVESMDAEQTVTVCERVANDIKNILNA